MIRFVSITLFFAEFLSVKAQPIELRFASNTMMNDLIVKNTPSYITTANGKYKIYSENIYLQSKPRLSFEVGGELNLNINKSVYLTSGALLGYRDFHLTYSNKNFLFDGNKISMEKHIYTATFPIGVRFKILRNFDLSLLLRNVFPIKTTKNISIANPDNGYILTMLIGRKTNNVFEEITLATNYNFKNWSIGLAYIRSVTTLERKITNGYACLIPANIYFSTIALHMSYRYQSLFRPDKKNTSWGDRQ